MASQWFDRRRIRENQDIRLRRLLAHAYRNVPYYRQLFDTAGVDLDQIGGVDDIGAIPITSKATLQDLPLDSLIAGYARTRHLHSLRSSGSTGRPFTVHFDTASLSNREALFLRALRTTGYRPGRRLMLVTAAASRPRLRRLLNWRYASVTAPPERLRSIFDQFAPTYLYGCVTPLRLLAEELGPTPRPRLHALITTGETLDRVTRRQLASAFGCEIFDFYGLSEIGLVGWECTEHSGYHVADETVLVEQVSMATGGGHARLVMTDLSSRAMPFIRFDSGDTGVLHPGPCPCGRNLTVLNGIDGRAVDYLTLVGGRRISPYAVTTALEDLLPAGRFQVVQTDARTVVVRIAPNPGSAPPSSEHVVGALQAVLGSLATIHVETDGCLPTTTGKWRVVQSQVGAATPA
jgi:phenylacetate-CoA ligase